MTVRPHPQIGVRRGLAVLAVMFLGAFAAPAAAATPVAEVVQPGAVQAAVDPVTMRISDGQDQSVGPLLSFPENLTVQIRNDDPDHEGPVVGAVVTFRITAGSAGFVGGAQVVQASTDVYGVAQYPLTAGATPGPVTVTATSPAVAAGVEFHETVQPARASEVLAISGGGQTAGLRDAFARPLQAEPVDEFGHPMVGVTVTFKVIPGEGRGTAAFADGTSQATATADSGGIATAPKIFAGTTTGPVLIFASYESARSAQYVLQVTYPDPATLTRVSGGGETVATGIAFAHPLQVRVVDDHGYPLTGPLPTIRFLITGGAGAFAGGATLVEVRVNSEGYATSPVLTAGDESGPLTVHATVESAPSLAVAFTETVAANVATTINAVSGSGQSVPASVGEQISLFPQQLVVVVKDQLGRPMAGAPVTFSAVGPASFLYGPTEATRSGIDGTAVSDTFHATTGTGGVRVTASIGGNATPATFTATVVPVKADASGGGFSPLGPTTPAGPASTSLAATGSPAGAMTWAGLLLLTVGCVVLALSRPTRRPRA